MRIPSEAELSAIRRTQAELAKPANRTAIDYYERNGNALARALNQYKTPDPTARMNEILKRFTVTPAGIDPKFLAGFGAANYGGLLNERHQSALQKILAAQLPVHTITSALDSMRVGGLQPSHALAARAFGAGVSDSLARAMPNLSAALATLPDARPPAGILGSARSALANFDMAVLGVQARLSVNDDLIAKVAGLNLGVPTASLLSAQIELAANRLSRAGLAKWSDLPAGSLAGLAGMASPPPLAGVSALDLMSVARGVYGVTSFAARAADMTVGDELGTEPDQTVDDWESGSLAEDLRAALTELHPALAAKLEGAWDVYRRRGPDALGQAATSLVELIDRSMDILAPPDDVKRYAGEQKFSGDRYFTDKGNPTVSLKVPFVLRDRPLTAEAVEAQVTALTKARKSLQSSKHGLDFSDDLLIGRLLLTVENVFTVILLG